MRIQVVALRRAERVIPRRANGLRAAVVVLKPGAVMDWHSTGSREELLIALAGRVQVHTATAPSKKRRGDRKNAQEPQEFLRFRDGDVAVVRAGQCAFLPRGTFHRVINPSMGNARYLYVTGSAA